MQRNAEDFSRLKKKKVFRFSFAVIPKISLRKGEMLRVRKSEMVRLIHARSTRGSQNFDDELEEGAEIL